MAGNVIKYLLGANYLIQSLTYDLPVLRIFSKEMLAVDTFQEIFLKIHSWRKWKSSAFDSV